jgi:hypothetical protein
LIKGVVQPGLGVIAAAAYTLLNIITYQALVKKNRDPRHYQGDKD